LPSFVSAQPPPAKAEEGYKNLKVLPPDITRPQLTVIMRNISGALGVHCDFCHAGQPPKMDWASDEKDEKKSARVMLKMTHAINKETLPQLEDMSADAEVTCYTCHRGAKHPTRRLGDVLAETAQSKGATAAIDEYRKLREESAEAGLYDFRPQQLTSAANRLREADKPDEALALLKATVTLFPKSSDAAASLGMALAQSGDKAGAEAELQRALTLDPNNFMAKGALDRLHGVAPPGPPR
jgi:tetratricopeptide (TPR) repeat protein